MHFLLLLAYRTESREEQSQLRSGPVVSMPSGRSCVSSHSRLPIEQEEPVAGPIQSSSSLPSPSEASSPSRTRDPPPLLGVVCVNAWVSSVVTISVTRSGIALFFGSRHLKGGIADNPNQGYTVTPVIWNRLPWTHYT